MHGQDLATFGLGRKGDELVAWKFRQRIERGDGKCLQTGDATMRHQTGVKCAPMGPPDWVLQRDQPGGSASFAAANLVMVMFGQGGDAARPSLGNAGLNGWHNGK